MNKFEDKLSEWDDETSTTQNKGNKEMFIHDSRFHENTTRMFELKDEYTRI